LGGGFIGVEFSDELKKLGMEVTLVEKMPEILNQAFDPELSVKIQKILTDRGVNVITGNGIAEVTGDNSVKGVKLENGEVIETDAVILSMGYLPNTTLAERAGIFLDENSLSRLMNTCVPDEADIFAVGDCAQKRDFITEKGANHVSIHSCAEARIAGMNLFQ
jgi:NADPH-dependent 2,4-dienoyl-CoA reductase/sulfur reductase-like enzyme